MLMGMLSGGFAARWEEYCGNPLYYVGVDVNPRCKHVERTSDMPFIETRSQLDRNFSSPCAPSAAGLFSSWTTGPTAMT